MNVSHYFQFRILKNIIDTSAQPPEPPSFDAYDARPPTQNQEDFAVVDSLQENPDRYHPMSPTRSPPRDPYAPPTHRIDDYDQPMRGHIASPRYDDANPSWDPVHSRDHTWDDRPIPRSPGTETTVLRGYRARGYRAQFGIFEKIESGAIKATYKNK